MTTNIVAKLRHAQLGLCELVRVEATDWIVRVESTGILFRVPSEVRSQFERVRDSAPAIAEAPVRIEIPAGKSATAKRARRIIESLRVGLPSLDGSTRRLAVGFREIESLINRFLGDIDTDGGGAMILKGEYGQGKTFALMILEQIALESGFVAVRTEIDATENRLNKPHHIYRNLIRNLRLPRVRGLGVHALVCKTVDLLAKECGGNAQTRQRWLNEQLGCFPLAWLLSDPDILRRPHLLGILECDPNFPAAWARTYHTIPPVPRTWPAFNIGTQGDFASFILSGIGRLARLLGFRGFVIILDEMEKWHLLNWTEQIRAGNLLGGLIWGATAEEGHRGCGDHPHALEHSKRCGGHPFTTEKRCHSGLAIAMTPRGHENPDEIWYQYGGPILVGEVPRLTRTQLIEHARLVAPFFAEAYGLAPPSDEELDKIAKDAMYTWRKYDDLTTRSGVQSVIAAFDSWRERRCFCNSLGWE